MPDVAERPPIAKEPISLILVAHNPGPDLEVVLRAWTSFLDSLKRPFEVILVNDGSTDDTAMQADMLASRSSRLRVIHHATRQGIGDALRSGIPVAQYPLLAYSTCDRQYQPNDLQRHLDLIDKVDVVIGYRNWLPVPPLLQALGKLYRGLVRVVFGIPLEPLPCWLGDHGQLKRWLARWAFGVRIRDVECALRLFRRSVFARIPVQSHGPFAQVEILAKANFLGCWMAEAQVSYQPPAQPGVQAFAKPTDSFLAEAYRLLSDPYFGPAVLPGDGGGSVAPGASGL
jgi:glycosyltransferase involved in cell wall biosynthesis